MSKKKTVFGKKAFLNNDGFHTVASVAYCFELENLDSGRPYGYGTMWFNDCSRIIALDLQFLEKEDYENSLFKLEAIRDNVDSAISDLKKAREGYVKASRKYKNKKKKLPIDK